MATNPFDSKTILDGIRQWVEIETPTEAPEQVNRLASLVAEGYRGLPATIERIAGKDGCGDHLVARSSWGRDQPGILVLSHLDTVHPMGFIERLPFRIEGDSAFGPGIYDMKGGAYLAYHAFRELLAMGAGSPLGVTQLYVSDEEIGSPTSRALIEAEGQKAKYVLVTEPARDGGKIVTARKGVGAFIIRTRGRPAHAGRDPGQGRSAITAMAEIVLAIEAMQDAARGITTNVGLIGGGTARNTVAEECSIEVDLRFCEMASASEMEAKIKALTSSRPGIETTVTGKITRPPFERERGVELIFQKAAAIAKEIGFALVSAPRAGGGSDGNFTVAMGIPTLDGLGVDGDGAHTNHEHMLFSSIEPRTRLLQGLMERLE